MKKDNPKDYAGKFIIARDLYFLEEVEKIKERDKYPLFLSFIWQTEEEIIWKL